MLTASAAVTGEEVRRQTGHRSVGFSLRGHWSHYSASVLVVIASNHIYTGFILIISHLFHKTNIKGVLSKNIGKYTDCHYINVKCKQITLPQSS